MKYTVDFTDNDNVRPRGQQIKIESVLSVKSLPFLRSLRPFWSFREARRLFCEVCVVSANCAAFLSPKQEGSSNVGYKMLRFAV